MPILLVNMACSNKNIHNGYCKINYVTDLLYPWGTYISDNLSLYCFVTTTVLQTMQDAYPNGTREIITLPDS